MKIILSSLILVTTFSVWAQSTLLDAAPLTGMDTTPVPVTEPELKSNAAAKEEKPFNHRASNWVTTFGFENMKYDVPYSYTGSQKTFKEEQNNLMGGRLGFGYEGHLGGGLLLGGRVEGYYLGTAFQNDKKATNAGGVTIGTEKDVGQILGGDLVGHAGWMFDFQTGNPFLGETAALALELFAEAGIGQGQAYNRKKYDYSVATKDEYSFTMTDNFTSTSVAFGLNILSRYSGFFLNLKVSQLFLDVDKRKIKGKSQVTDVPGPDFNETIKDPKVDTITAFTVGGGYKF